MKDKSTEKTYRPRAKFYVDKKGRFVHDAVIFLLLSMVFRVVGCWGLWNDRFFAITEILLPLCACLLFILILRFLGDKVFPLTILPMLAGVAFFIIKALGFESILHTVLCICLYVLIAVLYILTAIGIIRTKWVLVPLFVLPFLYHVFVEDLTALRDTANPVLFADGMQELSVLAIMLALLFTSLALKKRKLLEEANLPKIKDPIVKPAPKKPAVTAGGTTATTAAASQKPGTAAAQKPENAATAEKPATEAAAPAAESAEKEAETPAAADSEQPPKSE